MALLIYWGRWKRRYMNFNVISDGYPALSIGVSDLVPVNFS